MYLLLYVHLYVQLTGNPVCAVVLAPSADAGRTAQAQGSASLYIGVRFQDLRYLFIGVKTQKNKHFVTVRAPVRVTYGNLVHAVVHAPSADAGSAAQAQGSACANSRSCAACDGTL